MENDNTKQVRSGSIYEKAHKILYVILLIITIFYALTTGVFALFLFPLIVMWMMGSKGIEFYNVIDSKAIQKTDISYFTTGDILDFANLLLIVGVLVFATTKLRKAQNNPQ